MFSVNFMKFQRNLSGILHWEVWRVDRQTKAFIKLLAVAEIINFGNFANMNN